MAYLTHDAGTADNSRPKTTARVGFTEVENLVPCSPDRAGRIMAATVRDAEALKRLAAVSSRGRRLQKPVYHFSLSWAPDENPDQPTMLGAALDSLRVLGMRHHQAVVIEHRDREHPHLHVVVNRVSPEDGPRCLNVQRRPPPLEMVRRLGAAARRHPLPWACRRPRERPQARTPVRARTPAALSRGT